MKKMLACACIRPKVVDDAKIDAKNVKTSAPSAPSDADKPRSWFQRLRAKVTRTNKPSVDVPTSRTLRIKVCNHV